MWWRVLPFILTFWVQTDKQNWQSITQQGMTDHKIPKHQMFRIEPQFIHFAENTKSEFSHSV